MKSIIAKFAAAVLVTASMGTSIDAAITTTDTAGAVADKVLIAKRTVPNSEWFIYVGDIEEPLRSDVGNRVIAQLRTAPPKDVFHFFTCPAHKPGMQPVVIPDVPSNIRMRTRSMQKSLADVLRVFANPKEKDSKVDRGPPQIDVPRIPNSIASVRMTDFPANVIICGDPIYDGKPHHTGFSMQGGTVPTDETLLASGKHEPKHISPFRDGVKNMPKDAFVTFLAHDPKWGGIDHVHRSAVETFWGKFFKARGGAHLLRITASIDSAFKLDGEQEISGDLTIATHTEFGNQPTTMQSAQIDGKVVYLGRPKSKPPVFSCVEPEPVEKAFDSAMQSDSYSLVAIRYHHDESFLFTDLDLRARHPGFEDEMSFDNPNTKFAKLRNDVRYGETRNADKHEETFGSNWEVCYIRNKYLPQLEMWVDYYSGIGPIKLHVVQISNGKRRDAYYTMPGKVGDEAMESSKRNSSKAWLPLRLPLTTAARRESTASPAVVATAGQPKSVPTFKTATIAEAPVMPLPKSTVTEFRKRIPQVQTRLASVTPAIESKPATTKSVSATQSVPVVQAVVRTPVQQVSYPYHSNHYDSSCCYPR